ncbi:MAG: nucleotidyltransferase domain-containing protein [Bifidobacteriaceae bacterium]|jgi:predicted nucleotidyltransferase|nr:nucleotidyltransferase domain-containing protein [Bifidobacteriaceae bacterium]
MRERRKKALDYALDVLKQKDYVDSVWLHGSCAMNREGYYSDVNLAAVLKHEMSHEDAQKLRLEVNSSDYKLPEVNLNVVFPHFKERDDSSARILQKYAILLLQSTDTGWEMKDMGLLAE